MSANPPDPKPTLQVAAVWTALGTALVGLIGVAVKVVSDGFTFKGDGQQLAGIAIVIGLILAVALAVKWLARPDVTSGVPLLDKNNPKG